MMEPSKTEQLPLFPDVASRMPLSHPACSVLLLFRRDISWTSALLVAELRVHGWSNERVTNAITELLTAGLIEPFGPADTYVITNQGRGFTL